MVGEEGACGGGLRGELKADGIGAFTSETTHVAIGAGPPTAEDIEDERDDGVAQFKGT